MREDADDDVDGGEQAADRNAGDGHTSSCPIRLTDRGHDLQRKLLIRPIAPRGVQLNERQRRVESLLERDDAIERTWDVRVECAEERDVRPTHHFGVKPIERWDYFDCAACGPFIYRDRTRKLRPTT